MKNASSKFEEIKVELVSNPRIWVITGVAGFIGSNLLESLLNLNQRVRGLDNFSTGFTKNLDDVESSVTKEQWSNFSFIEGDILNSESCQKICDGADFILHQAALGSVPRSIADPYSSNNSNITGFLNMLIAAKNAEVKRFVYAASSSTYGDHPALPKIEENIGEPLSPYAVTKLVNELYASVFKKTYNFDSIGLRYFNIFGKRQTVNSAYAAVVPKWIGAIIEGQAIQINGDGETSRDFTYVENAVQANILSATSEAKDSMPLIFNIAAGERTSLLKLFECIKENIDALNNEFDILDPIFADFRSGDVRHSLADISKARTYLGYEPSHDVDHGIKEAVQWYMNELNKE
ncbi:GDP-mannose 4,6-dehydratase [Pseudomonadota bacterium]|nr:GDP-mannose 4,6-dehydratase [Pseudomonadota bacterium]